MGRGITARHAPFLLRTCQRHTLRHLTWRCVAAVPSRLLACWRCRRSASVAHFSCHASSTRLSSCL